MSKLAHYSEEELRDLLVNENWKELLVQAETGLLLCRGCFSSVAPDQISRHGKKHPKLEPEQYLCPFCCRGIEGELAMAQHLLSKQCSAVAMRIKGYKACMTCGGIVRPGFPHPSSHKLIADFQALDKETINAIASCLKPLEEHNKGKVVHQRDESILHVGINKSDTIEAVVALLSISAERRGSQVKSRPMCDQHFKAVTGYEGISPVPHLTKSLEEADVCVICKSQADLVSDEPPERECYSYLFPLDFIKELPREGPKSFKMEEIDEIIKKYPGIKINDYHFNAVEGAFTL